MGPNHKTDHEVVSKLKNLFPTGSVAFIHLHEGTISVPSQTNEENDEENNEKNESLRYLTISFTNPLVHRSALQVLNEFLNIRSAWDDSSLSILLTDKLVHQLTHHTAYQALRYKISLQIDNEAATLNTEFNTTNPPLKNRQ